MAIILKSPNGCIKLSTPIHKAPEVTTKRITTNASGYYVKYFEDISKYRINKYEADKDGNEWYKDYPLLEDKDGQDYQQYIFFGWFEDKECNQAIAIDKVDGSAFAKFYPVSTTIIRSTVEPNVTMESAKGYNRMYYRTPTLSLEKIGISITLPTGKTQEATTTSVSTFQTFEENGYTYKITADETDEAMADGKITSTKMNNVPQSYFSLPWNYRLLYITSDGTKMYGITNIGRMQDYLEQYINVPIYMKVDKEATDISFNVNYNTRAYTFNNIDSTGCLFDNATVEEVEEGVLKVTLNGESVKLDNTIVNLRFKAKSVDKIAPITTFKVSNEKIYNNDKEVKVNIENGQYLKWVLQVDVTNKYIW